MEENIEMKGTIILSDEFVQYCKDQDWDADTWRQEVKGTAHKDTKSVYLRTVKELTPDEVFNGMEAMTTDVCLQSGHFRQLLQYVTTTLELAVLGRAMLVKLAPDGVIDSHVDEGEYAFKHNRYHIPIVTNNECMFMIDEDDPTHLEKGYIYQIANKKLHCTWNNGSEDRIHLVFDGIPLEGADPLDWHKEDLSQMYGSDDSFDISKH